MISSVCSKPHSLFDDVSNAKALNPQAEKAHTHAQEHIRIKFPPERKEEKLSKIFVGLPHPLLVPWSGKGRAIPLLPLWAVRPVHSLSSCTWVPFTYLTFLLVEMAFFRPIKLGSIEGLCIATVTCVWPVVCGAFCMSNFLSQE